jgi:hypothetical protein
MPAMMFGCATTEAWGRRKNTPDSRITIPDIGTSGKGPNLFWAFNIATSVHDKVRLIKVRD